MQKTAIIVTPCPSHPTTAGNRARVYEMGRRLRDYGFRVLLIHYDCEQVNQEAHDSMRAYWDEYHAVRVPPDRRSMERLDPDTFCSHELRSTVSRLCQEAHASLVIVNYVWMAGALDAVPAEIVKVVDVHDRFGYRHDLLRLMGTEPSWVTLSPHQEATAASKADILWCVSRQETHYFQQLVDRPVYYMGHPVQASFVTRPNYDGPPKFLFFGSYNPVNQQSLRAIERAAAALTDEAEFLVCGGVVPLLSTTATKNLTSVGYVRDFAEYFEAGWISVNPVFVGTGNKIKTIDSLRYGAPIISGCAGFDGVDTDEPLHQLRDEHAFLDALHRVAAGEVSVGDLAATSQRVFAEFEATSRAAFEDFLESSLSSGPRRRPLLQPLELISQIQVSLPDTVDDPRGEAVPATWSKPELVRLAHGAFHAGRLDLGLAAVTASLALDPISARLNLLRAFAAFSLGRHREADDALATYEWLLLRGAADYAPASPIAGTSAVFAAGDAPALVSAMTRIGEAMGPTVTDTVENLNSRDAARLAQLKAHLARTKPDVTVAAVTMLPKTRGSQLDQLKHEGIFAALVFIAAEASAAFAPAEASAGNSPAAMLGTRSRILTLEAPQAANIYGGTVRYGDEQVEFVRHSPGRFVLPLELLFPAPRGEGKLLELTVRGHISDGNFDRFANDLRLDVQDVPLNVPRIFAGHRERGAVVLQLRDLGLGSELRGSGWHNADRLADGSFGRWTRKTFSIVQRAINYPNTRIFVEIEAASTKQTDKPLVESVKIEGRSLEFHVEGRHGNATIWIEVPPESAGKSNWEVEITSSLDERIAGEHDPRVICLYVTQIKVWAIVAPMGGDVDILNWSRGTVPMVLGSGEAAEYRVCGFRASLGALLLELIRTDADHSAGNRFDAGEFALEWDGHLLAPSSVNDTTLVFPFRGDAGHGGRLRLYAPTPQSSLADTNRIRSLRFSPGVKPAARGIYSSRQDRYWEGFYPAESFEAGFGRWMSTSGTLHFVAPEESVLTLYLFRQSAIRGQGRITALLDGAEVAYRIEPWRLGEAMFVFKIPAAPGERRLILAADQFVVPGNGDLRELSILVHRFIVEPQRSAQEEGTAMKAASATKVAHSSQTHSASPTRSSERRRGAAPVVSATEPG